ncbi:MAG: EAL domain-containing protein [Rhodocyclaceae bacterium]|nr:EAL domain-containing protein [Rhodocyclaceae bacterium]
MPAADEPLVFLDDALPKAESPVGRPPWRLLVVDDDIDVHEATRYALRDIDVLGRPLVLEHAYSAEEAFQALSRPNDIGVILLDVVMETDDAGLALVDRIRTELGLRQVRIILRTGQPGQAPEIDVIRRYDINDYRTKSELTRTRLYTTVVAAIRAYDQLHRMDESRKGLEKIVSASNGLIAEQGLETFSEGVITQIASLIGVPAEGVVCARGGVSRDEVIVIAAAGRYGRMIHSRVSNIEAPRIARALLECLEQRRNVVTADSVTLYIESQHGVAYAAFVDSERPVDAIDCDLLQVFCSNIARCADNIHLVDELKRQAYSDRLLGLPNRSAMLGELDRHLGPSATPAEAALAVLDIDQFSSINDMFGHRFGDALLVAAADRLRSHLPNCYVARVSGGAFGVLCPQGALAEARIGAVFDAPLEVAGIDHALSVSSGIVRLKDVQGDGGSCFQNAYIALKRAKAQGAGHSVIYTPGMSDEAHNRSRILGLLQGATSRGELFPVFQPQIDLAERRVVGLEALLRWRTATGELIPPGDFIPIAERSALILTLGDWILRQALDALRHLARHGHADLKMAVNVSVVQLHQPDFIERLDAALKETGVEPGQLELEITESAAALGNVQLAPLLGLLRQRGVRIAIDDFGTGFSSLAYLDKLPADCLKIDRSFIHQLDGGHGTPITDLIVPLGHRLGMRVLAEGVETESQLRILRQLGCDGVQGFLLGRPMPLDELTGWLTCPAPAFPAC